MAEFVYGEDRLESKVFGILRKAFHPVLEHISVMGEEQVVTTPPKIRALFNGQQVVLYGFLDRLHDRQHITLKAQSKEGPVVLKIPVVSLAGRRVHVLTAQAKINELLIGSNIKQDIVNLALHYGLVTKYTSFVVVKANQNNVLASMEQIPR